MYDDRFHLKWGSSLKSLYQMQVSLISRPVNQLCDCHIDWGKCGLVALAAEKSVLLYHATPNDLKYLRSIEPGTHDICCLKFHQTMPILAVAEKHAIYFWDCETGDYICNLKMDHVTAIGWKDDTLVILRKACYVHVFDYNSQKLLWKVDLDTDCKTMSVDPFHPFRVVFTYKKKPGFVVIESPNPQTQPTSPFDRQMLNIELNNAVFHVQIPNLIVLVCPSQIVVFEYRTKSLTTIIQNETDSFKFKSVIMSNFTLEILHVMCSDGSLAVFRRAGSGYTKVSDHRLNRALSGTDFVIASPTDTQQYLYCSQANGLSLIQSNLDRSFVVKRVSFFPVKYTCFDCAQMLICLGTETGEVVVMNAETAEIIGLFSVQDHLIKDVRFEGTDIVHFLGEHSTGSVNIKSRQILHYDQRSGPAISIYASDGVCVLMHSKYAIGLIRNGVEIPFVFDHPIASIAPQISRTNETDFVENSPNVAVLLGNGQVHIISYNRTKPVLKFTLPNDSPQPSAISWHCNTLMVADLNGSILIHDFQTKIWQKIAGPVGITNIDHCGDNVIFQSRDGGVYMLRNHRIHKFPVHVSHVRSSHSHFLLCMSGDKLKVFDRNCEFASPTTNALQPALDRLKAIVSSDVESPREISYLYANQGFVLESAMWRVIDRFLGGPPLPLSYAYFGGKDELIERLIFVDSLITNTTTLTATIHKMNIKAKLGDLKGVSEAMLKMNATEDYYVMGALAGALLFECQVSERAKEILKMTAVSMLQKDKSSEYAHILLLISGMPLVAVKYLQELGKWDESMEILKCLDLTDDTKHYIRKCAHHWLEADMYEVALLIFASIGDFHPVLSILTMLEKNHSAAHLIAFLERSTGSVKEYDDESSQIVKMESIRKQIISYLKP